ncbi:MAG: methylated-DNA--[protein]-cysteine S-methyltransferase [Candidatus Limnocylindria bacterium]
MNAPSKDHADLVAESRERLLQRAKREDLVTVGYSVLDSPLGPLWAAVGPRGVATISYGGAPDARELRRLVAVFGPGIVPDRRATDELERELDQYFEGKRREFAVAFDLTGLTPFYRAILRATAKVPYGRVTTYAAVARRAGNERASRAAGGALSWNPIPIVVPCHRVVATDGSLSGYAGGLDAKRRLLALERGEAPEGGWPSQRGLTRGRRAS